LFDMEKSRLRCCASILLRARDDQDGRSVVAAGRACS
jgi:hypothetical protein